MTLQKLVIQKKQNELKKVENFVEKISDQHNINHTYYSNILITLLELSKVAISDLNKTDNNENIVITFNNKEGKFIFILEGISNMYFHKRKKEKQDFNEKLYENCLKIIKSLSDKLYFDDNGNRICVEFHVDKVNEFLSKMRKKELAKYSAEIYKCTDAIDQKD